MTKITDDLEFIKDVLDDHKSDIENIKTELKSLNLKLNEIKESLKKSDDLTPEKISDENQITESKILMKNLAAISSSLSELKESIGKSSNFQFPIPISNSPTPPHQPPKPDHTILKELGQKPEPNLNLERFQLLFILKQSKAVAPQLAVSAKQLQSAFSIDKTVRTIHNKLDALCEEGYIVRIGKKPVLYFLSQSGLNAINKQERNVFAFTPQEY